MAYIPLLDKYYPFLQQFQLDARGRIRPAAMGTHITRRRGQSMEFHDYVRYTPGDDTRHLDWRATMRRGGAAAMQRADEWLVRRFTAEENLQLFISIDPHLSMRTEIGHQKRTASTVHISKYQLALWLAEALTFITVTGKLGDKVFWHLLFDEADAHTIIKVDRLAQSNAAFQRLTDDKKLLRLSDNDLCFNQRPIERELRPAFVWVIISDFYFSHDYKAKFEGRIMDALRGNRSIILIDIDSWGYEKAILKYGFRQIVGPRPDNEEPRVYLDDPRIQEIEQRIAEHKQGLLKNLAGVDFSERWHWQVNEREPKELNLEMMGNFFQAEFSEDEKLRQIFMRDI